MKTPGGSNRPPNQPEPELQGGASVAPYGKASDFNPQFSSVLPVGPDGQPLQTQTAMLSDPIRDQAGARTPLLEQQQGMPMAAQSNGRDALAAIMEKLNGMGGRGFRPGGSRDRSGGVQDRSPSGDRAAGKGLY